jgi:WD40 repeat protein
VGALAFRPDGKTLASLGVVGPFDRGGELHTWQLKPDRPLLERPQASARSLATGPGTDFLIVAGNSDEAQVLDWSAGRVLLKIHGNIDFGFAAASPDGSLVATGSDDLGSGVDLRDAGTGAVLRRLAPPEKRLRRDATVSGLVFSHDGRTLAACWGNEYEWQNLGAVRCWDVATGRVIWTNLGEREGYLTIAFSPDGGSLIAGAGMALNSERPGDVLVWRASDGRMLRRLRGHTRQVLTVAVSLDGARIASGALDQSIRLWDPDSGSEVLNLPGHAGGVRSLAFSPDGSLLASGGEDHVIRIWDAVPRETSTETIAD